MAEERQGNPERFSNEYGVVAEQYSQLQAVHILEAANLSYPLPRASNESTLRAMFQAMEIALLNANDLLSRAMIAVQNGSFGAAAVKLSWTRGFHSVMVKISVMPHRLGIVQEVTPLPGVLRITDSPAFQAYVETLKQFDLALLDSIRAHQLPLDTLLAQQSCDSNQLRLIHLIRLCNHETTIWESNLRAVSAPVAIPDYGAFVLAQGMRDAVYDTQLRGDTYYTQFRGLHQIPEILTAEMNNHLEKAIVEIRAHRPQRAYEHLRYTGILSEGILASLLPIADNLTTADYHKIRENLGLTSGSHSVNIHYHLFRDLYEQLWDAFVKHLLDTQAPSSGQQEIPEIIRRVDLKRFENQDAFLTHLFANELLRLHAFIFEWRNEHLHLPRNNVGGGQTKSLTGSPDAVQAVKKMRNAAIIKDPVRPLIDARLDARRPPKVHPAEADDLPLTAYFNSPESLDRIILESTGEITRQRFKHVQERTGFFAQKSPFIPPPRYEV